MTSKIKGENTMIKNEKWFQSELTEALKSLNSDERFIFEDAKFKNETHNGLEYTFITLSDGSKFQLMIVDIN
jgi:hypothetical protein